MSLPREEARALSAAEKLLIDLGNGTEKRIPSATRQRARDAMRHFPINAAGRWLRAENRRAARRYTHDPAHHPLECLEAAMWDLAGEGPEHRDENLSHGLQALAALQSRGPALLETLTQGVRAQDSLATFGSIEMLRALLDQPTSGGDDSEQLALEL